MRLDEVASTALPAAFAVGGVRLGSSALIVWSDDPLIAVVSLADLQRIGVVRLDDPIVHVEETSLGDFEVLHATELHLHSRDGPLRRRLWKADGVIAVSGLRIANQWIVLGRERAGELVLIAIDSTGRERRVRSPPVVRSMFELADSSLARPVLIGDFDGRVVVTQVQSPHLSVLLDSHGVVQREWQPPETSVDTIGGAKVVWVALPMIQLYCGAIQTIADLTSDRRRLVAFDDDGRVLRSVEMEVPLGIAASIPSNGRVFALRRAAGLEVVEYRFRWVNQPSSEESRRCDGT
ncbi:MAG: hypothetical protein JNL44_11465 [Gemmatimonadetes bacterium]|nr:hypothetical protein [Gemmatimonadota bacterium]